MLSRKAHEALTAVTRNAKPAAGSQEGAALRRRLSTAAVGTVPGRGLAMVASDIGGMLIQGSKG